MPRRTSCRRGSLPRTRRRTSRIPLVAQPPAVLAPAEPQNVRIPKRDHLAGANRFLVDVRLAAADLEIELPAPVQQPGVVFLDRLVADDDGAVGVPPDGGLAKDPAV